MRKFTLAFSRNGSIIPDVPELSDLVALGILPKQISEFTNDDIGTIINIPYTDESGIISGPIEFEVVGVNHHKDINDETKPTITLMSKNLLRHAAFDAKESNNPDSDRQEMGNNRWSVSNIRQWLNSESAANSWPVPQHRYDDKPNASNVEYNKSGAYSDEAGFLAGFSSDIKQHLATVKNKTILCDYDKSSLGVDFEETEDKVFLPSYTEMGYGNLDDNNPEGTWLSNKFTDHNSRVKGSLDDYYWMRSPIPDSSFFVCEVTSDGTDNGGLACAGDNFIAPLLVLR